MTTRKIISIIASIVILWMGSILAYTLSYTDDTALQSNTTASLLNPKTHSKNWIAVDTNSGNILGQQNAEKKVPIASLIKILVAYTVLTEVDNKNIKLSDTATLSKYGHAISQDAQLSNAPMSLNEEYTVEELLSVMMTASANNAAITLSERVAGSEQSFITLMERNLKRMGISNYVLNNVTGLDAESIPKEFNDNAGTNLFTSKDLSTITQKLITQYPEILKTTSQTNVLFNNTQVANTNQFITGDISQPSGWNISGLKTGTTESAGFGLITVGNTQSNTKPTIVVVLEAKTDVLRYEDTKTIFETIGG